jgi:hypothetical protein
MTIYLCTFKPKKTAEKAGAKILVTAVESVNASRAAARADVLLEDRDADAIDNYFKVIVSEVPAGIEAPALNTFDDSFSDRYLLTGDTWELISEQADDKAATHFLTNLPIDIKIVSAYVFGAKFILNDEELKQIYGVLNDLENNLNIKVVMTALMGIEALKHAYLDKVINLVSEIKNKFGTKVPMFIAVRDFADKWINTPASEREKITISQSASEATEKRKYADIDMDVALAVSSVDLNTQNVVEINRARNIVKENSDENYKRISMNLRRVDGITSCSRDEIYILTQKIIADPDLANNQLNQSTYIADWASNTLGIPAAVSEPIPEPEVKNLGGGKFSISGLVDSQAEKTASSDIVKTSVENNFIDDKAEKTTDKKSLNNAVEATELSTSDNFVSRADAIEKNINEQTASEKKNLDLWSRVYRTDEKYTKEFTYNGGGTSINGTYMTMQATKMFGSFGVGWGVDVLEERFDNGTPLFQNGSKEVIPNGCGGYLTTVNHVIKIKLWYLMGESRGEVIAYGCTPYITSLSNYDSEAPKKSLTDATKKALSQLGFSADIFLGLYDDWQYRAENKVEFAIKNASEKAEDVIRLREELDEKFTRVAEIIKTAVSENEVKKVHDNLAREINVHKESAKAKADHDAEKYFSGRLRRLSELKAERIAELSTSGEVA